MRRRLRSHGQASLQVDPQWDEARSQMRFHSGGHNSNMAPSSTQLYLYKWALVFKSALYTLSDS